MHGPRQVRKMEEFWLTRGEWGVVCVLEGLAILSVVAAVLLMGVGIGAMAAPSEPTPLQARGEYPFPTTLAAPLFFAAAIPFFSWALGLYLIATVLRFRGSFRLLIHHQIPTPNMRPHV